MCSKYTLLGDSSVLLTIFDLPHGTERSGKWKRPWYFTALSLLVHTCWPWSLTSTHQLNRLKSVPGPFFPFFLPHFWCSSFLLPCSTSVFFIHSKYSSCFPLFFNLAPRIPGIYSFFPASFPKKRLRTRKDWMNTYGKPGQAVTTFPSNQYYKWILYLFQVQLRFLGNDGTAVVFLYHFRQFSCDPKLAYPVR